LGLHQAAWILSTLRPGREHIPFAHRISDWPRQEQTLFCWEAFVSEGAHSDDHVRDAASALAGFFSTESDLVGATEVHAERPLSLIGTAALWSGWTDDAAALFAESAVIRPTQAFDGPILQIAASATPGPR
jgi:hypothetical protein